VLESEKYIKINFYLVGSTIENSGSVFKKQLDML
jgi:hypothetical protein